MGTLHRGSEQTNLGDDEPGLFCSAHSETSPNSPFWWPIIKHFRDNMTREEMHYILFDAKAWEMLVQRSGLDRDEANMLHHILMEELMQNKEASMLENLSEEEKIFLYWFPLQKNKLKKNIRELHALADQVDAMHKTFTKTSLVASSSGTVSGVMSILGFALAPVTVGGSLMLSAAGLGLGVAAVATNTLTSILERNSNSAARDRASRLVPVPAMTVHDSSEERGCSEISAALLCIDKCVRAFKNLKELRAFQMAKANSGFMAKVNKFIAMSHIPFWRTGGLQRAVGASVMPMTKVARLLGAAGAGLSLMQDLRSLRQSWTHLEEGAKAKTAEELRAVAGALEQELDQLTQRYELIIRGQGQPKSQEHARPGRAQDTQGWGTGSKSATNASSRVSRRPGANLREGPNGATERHTERHRQREKQTLQEEPDVQLDPRSQDHTLSQRQMVNC
ncbi:Apolipoprotein L5 [Vulpes lagopus]